MDLMEAVRCSALFYRVFGRDSRIGLRADYSKKNMRKIEYWILSVERRNHLIGLMHLSNGPKQEWIHLNAAMIVAIVAINVSAVTAHVNFSNLMDCLSVDSFINL